MDDTPTPLPPDLRWLKGLVAALMVVMMLSAVAVVALLWWRLPAPVRVPEALEMPAGAEPLAVTRGRGWWVVTTTDGRALMFDAGGTLAGEVALAVPGG